MDVNLDYFQTAFRLFYINYKMRTNCAMFGPIQYGTRFDHVQDEC